MSRLTGDGTAEPVSRDQILRHARGQGNVHFPCSADHEQDWQPYPVDPYSAICDYHIYIHTYPHHFVFFRLVRIQYCAVLYCCYWRYAFGCKKMRDSCHSGVSDGSRLALYQTLSIGCPLSYTGIFFWYVHTFNMPTSYQ